jgi:hypothetical protein
MLENPANGSLGKKLYAVLAHSMVGTFNYQFSILTENNHQEVDYC